MAAQHEIHTCASCSPQDDGVMCQQELHLIIQRAGQCQRQIFQSHHGVIYTRQPERLSALLKTHSLINQHRNPFGTKEVGNQSRVGPMIMIAKNSKDTVTRS